MGYPHGRETPTCLVTQGALRTAHVGHLVSMVGKLAKFVGGPLKKKTCCILLILTSWTNLIYDGIKWDLRRDLSSEKIWAFQWFNRQEKGFDGIWTWFILWLAKLMMSVCFYGDIAGNNGNSLLENKVYCWDFTAFISVMIGYISNNHHWKGFTQPTLHWELTIKNTRIRVLWDSMGVDSGSTSNDNGPNNGDFTYECRFH